jgi:hypothetical protein
MDVSGDDIADVVLKQFDVLPAKAKPLVRGGGVREWVPLSGIVAQGNPEKAAGIIARLTILMQGKIASLAWLRRKCSHSHGP